MVLGAPPARPPFDDVTFLPVRPLLAGRAGRNRRYAGGVAARAAPLAPALVEVHNRPDLALFLARRFPRHRRSGLFLNNDPQGMRGGASPAERARAAGALARIGTSSAWLRGPPAARASPAPARPAGGAAELARPGARCRPRRPSGSGVILFAGRVVADKGADAFVAACARALPRSAGLAGGDDRRRPLRPRQPGHRLPPRAARRGRGGRGAPCWATGRTPRCWRRWRRAAIVVVPSRWPEPFGLTALEAMAAARPCSAPPRGGLPRVHRRRRRDDRSGRPARTRRRHRRACQRPRPPRGAGRGRAGAGAAVRREPRNRPALDALRSEIDWPHGRAAPGRPI